LNVKKKLAPSVEKQNWAKQSTIGGGCGYPRHPGAAPAEHGGGMARITSVPGDPGKEIIATRGVTPFYDPHLHHSYASNPL